VIEPIRPIENTKRVRDAIGSNPRQWARRHGATPESSTECYLKKLKLQINSV